MEQYTPAARTWAGIVARAATAAGLALTQSAAQRLLWTIGGMTL
jgi:hypothetical protein